MSVDQKISALTAALRSEFWKAWHQVAEPAPIMQAVTIIPSTTSIENYVNFTPVPAFKEWKGNRSYGSVSSFVYSVQNKTWHDEIMCTLEDVEDDQTGGLLMQPAMLSEKGKIWPNRRTLEVLAAGASTIGFDGTNFAANSHSFGVGDNLLSAPALADASSGSATSGNTYTMWGLYHGNKVLKPMFWQLRDGPVLRTNAGTPQSYEARQLRWWVDMRGEAAPGYWWNAVKMTMTGLPSITEMHGIFQQFITALHGFKYPQTDATDAAEVIHEQVKFNATNYLYACSTGLDTVMSQALHQEWVPQSGINVGGTGSTTVATKNQWLGKADYLISHYFD